MKKGSMFNISTTFNYKIKHSYGVGIGVGQDNHNGKWLGIRLMVNIHD